MQDFQSYSNKVPFGYLARLRSGTLGNRPVRTRMPGGVGGRGMKAPFLSLLGEIFIFEKFL
jgi:hypothetical protein